MPHPNGPAHEMGDFVPLRAALEERYIVFKLSDVAKLTQQREDALYRIAHDIKNIRKERGADPHMPCIVVEKDWPEYGPTLRAILERVDREDSAGVASAPAAQPHDSTGAMASAWFGTSAPRAVEAVFGVPGAGKTTSEGGNSDDR